MHLSRIPPLHCSKITCKKKKMLEFCQKHCENFEKFLKLLKLIQNHSRRFLGLSGIILKCCFFHYYLLVSPAVTRLTVYRQLRVHGRVIKKQDLQRLRSRPQFLNFFLFATGCGRVLRKLSRKGFTVQRVPCHPRYQPSTPTDVAAHPALCELATRFLRCGSTTRRRCW